MDIKKELIDDNPLSDDISPQNEEAFFIEDAAVETNNDVAFLEDDCDIAVKIEIKSESSFSDLCSENERALLTEHLGEQSKVETLTSDINRTIIHKIDFEEETLVSVSDFGSQNETELLSGDPVKQLMKCNSDYEAGDKVEIKEELSWLKTETSFCSDIKMLQNMVRTTTKAQWSSNDLTEAIAAINNGMGIRKASRTFSIPFSTLRGRHKSGITAPGKLGCHAVFTIQQEKEIVDNMVQLSKLFYGITYTELRRLAFEFAEKLGLKHRFNKLKRCAGNYWVRGFMKRNPTVSLQKPEASSLNRICTFNKEEVSKFYKNLQKVYEKYSFPPSRIFNQGETGISNVHKPCKGEKPVGVATSGERGRNVCVSCAMSASGIFVPPMFIFPQEQMNPLLEVGGPPGGSYKCTKNGWMNDEVFVTWLEHFAAHVKPSLTDPVLLICDNNRSHISLAAYEFCKQSGIIMISIPPHTSHKLQPLNVTFYGPLKTALNKGCSLFVKGPKLSPSGQKRVNYDLASVFNKAFMKVATMATAVTGFQKTGILPLNPNIYTEEDFLPVQTEVAQVVPVDSPITELQQKFDVMPKEVPSALSDDAHNMFQFSSTNSGANPSTTSGNGDAAHTSWDQVTLQDVSPFQIVESGRNQNRSTRKQHFQILTSASQKVCLEKMFRKRKIRNIKDVKQTKVQKRSRPTVKGKDLNKTKESIHHAIYFENSSEEDTLENLCDKSDDFSHENEACLVCGEQEIKTEIWYRCVSCGQWAHALCSGWESPVGYICDFCE